MGEQGSQLQPMKKEIGPTRTSSFEAMFDEMRQTFDTIAQRDFELFDPNGRQPGRDLDDWLRAESEFLHPVNLEVGESESAVRVRAEVPGFDAKDLEISLEPSRLTISGKREWTSEEKKKDVVYSDCRSNQLFRSLDLPAEVNAEKATATLKQGVLELILPKAIPSKKVKIEPESA